MSETHKETYTPSRANRINHKPGKKQELRLLISFVGELECKNLGGCEHADQGTKERFAYDLGVTEGESLILPFHCNKCDKPAPVELKVSGIRWGVG